MHRNDFILLAVFVSTLSAIVLVAFASGFSGGAPSPMSSSSQLPQWVSYLQALAVPIIAIIGAWIAARQMLIANDKLQLDAFDRQYEKRVAVYEATRKILEGVFREKLTEADVRVYGLYALDAQFLFDDKIYTYLKSLRHHIDAWVFAKTTLTESIPNAERAKYEQTAQTHLDWIIKQGDEKTGFATRFAPFLVYRQTRRPWLLRWP